MCGKHSQYVSSFVCYFHFLLRRVSECWDTYDVYETVYVNNLNNKLKIIDMLCHNPNNIEIA